MNFGKTLSSGSNSLVQDPPESSSVNNNLLLLTVLVFVTFGWTSSSVSGSQISVKTLKITITIFYYIFKIVSFFFRFLFFFHYLLLESWYRTGRFWHFFAGSWICNCSMINTVAADISRFSVIDEVIELFFISNCFNRGWITNIFRNWN